MRLHPYKRNSGLAFLLIIAVVLIAADVGLIGARVMSMRNPSGPDRVRPATFIAPPPKNLQLFEDRNAALLERARRVRENARKVGGKSSRAQ